MASKKKSYVAAPAVPEDLMQRYSVMMQVLSGAMTVSEGARVLGLSRNHFQTLMHQALHGFVLGLSPKLPGRPSRPESEKKLLEENERLQRENDQLQSRVETIERMLGVASDLIRGRTNLRARSKKDSTPATEKKETSDDDDESRLARATELRAMGLSAELVAALAGVSAPTLRRWRARGLPSYARPAAAPVAPELARCVDSHVRELHGLVGAESIRRSIPGISRRQAATLKRATLTAMERERVARAERVVVTVAGVVRGFDQMYVATTEGQQLLLFSNDGAVQYRTSVMRSEHYDEASVAAAVARDFELHGAPLVWRADRHKSHDAPAVRAVLEQHGVLRLQGPPRHPRFYGQTERGNREHRAWLDMLGALDPTELDEACVRMLLALNRTWKRPTLGWQAAHDAWTRRPRLAVDRRALHDEVAERADRLRRSMARAADQADLAQRLAIEQALTNRGFLRRVSGGWC